MSEGRPVPVHASGGGCVVKDCIICGLPYDLHGRDPKNWLECPSREQLVEIERDLEEQLARVSKLLSAKTENRKVD